MKHWLRTGFFAIAGLAFAGTAALAQPVINEAVYDDAGGDDETWVEIKGDAGLDLTGYTLVGVNGNGGTEYMTVDLVGLIPASGYFVVGQAFGDQIADTDFQNGPDSILLRDAAGATIDAVGYGSFDPDEVFAGEGTPTVDPGPDISIARCPDGSDTDNNGADFFADDTPTPGSANDVECAMVPMGACCVPGAGCQVVSEADCNGLGGEYLGDDTVCDPDPCAYQQLTVCEIMENDMNGFPVLFGQRVETEGVVNSINFSNTTNEYSITDGGCCVTIFGGDMAALNIGDVVLVTGEVDFFNGLTEVSIDDVAVIGTDAVPAAIEVSTNDLATGGEIYESCLIKLTCVTITDGSEFPADGSNGNLTVDDGSGPTTMRIDKETDIDGTATPGGAFSVLGIGGQFDSSSPYDEGYQMRPRSLADFTLDDPDCGPMREGACCVEEMCEILTEDECAARPGVYQGDDTVCDPNPCDIVPTIERSWGQIKGSFKN